MNDGFELGLAETMTTIATVLHEARSVDTFLNRIAAAAHEHLPGVDYASVSVVRRRGRLETAAVTDPLVKRLDAIQYELNEGPCVDAIQGPGQVWTTDVGSDPRWPSYRSAASDSGVAAQLASRLDVQSRVFGGLNLYSTSPAAFDGDMPRVVALFATHAAHALGRLLTETQLNEAVATRQLVGQAVGIVMERYHLDQQRAFAFLTRTSQNGNVKMRDVAAQVVSEVHTTPNGSVPDAL